MYIYFHTFRHSDKPVYDKHCGFVLDQNIRGEKRYTLEAEK